MRIIYSPEFNSTSYINLEQRKGQLLGLKVCGSRELLSELELRAGIVVLEQSEPERLVAFHDSLSKNVGGTIFEDSFKTDEVGVARQLMTWCDNLLMAGWSPDKEVNSDKLKALAKITKGVVGKHVAQRWQDLTIYFNNHAVFQKDDVLEIHMKELIPAVIQLAIDQLAKQATVEYINPEGEITTDIKVYQFKTRTEAYRWYLSQPDVLMDVNVTISSDNRILNDMAVAMGRPVVNSKSQNSNPQLLQLFKLGMSLFARPINVYNLLSYLQIPGHPLGGVAYKLARVLAKEGGINEKWQQTIDEYDFTDEDGKDKRDDRLVFIEMLNKDYVDGKILVDDVKVYANKLAHWCDQLLQVESIEEERKEQLVVLSSFCRSLQQILPADGYISAESLKMHVEGIYQPQSFTHMKAQKGSPDTISTVTQLVDKANKVCWLGCVGATASHYPFDFLNTSEYQMLQQEGITVPSKSDFCTTHHHSQMDALKNVGELILVTWEYEGNERQEEHPVVTELKHLHKDAWNTLVIADAEPNLETDKGNISCLSPQSYYQLTDKLAKLKREKESYTSIDSLIQHPFDYTVEHLLGLKEPQIGQLPNLDTTKGLVAHLFVEMLFDKYGEQLAAGYQQLDQKAKDLLIDDAIQQTGAILLLPEYKLECMQFKAILKDSITALTNIIQYLHLKPIGSEVKIDVDLDTIGAFDGSIDMVLKNDLDQLVIFDFKWSEGKSFQQKLEENKSIQLELYRQAAEKQLGKMVVGMGYYQFPKMTLYTTHFEDADYIRKITPKTEAKDRNLGDEIRASYQYRRNGELDKGIVEESELQSISDTNYDNQTEKTLYPLDIAFKTKDRKSCPYVKVDKPPFAKKKAGWDTPTDPKEIKTTHPILKGRLL